MFKFINFIMKVYCGWCGKYLYEKEGEGTGHGICEQCYAEQLKKI